MAHALALAARGLGRTWPNPAVGCVIVRDGRVLGRGWTQPGGRPHAERRALDQAGDAQGATAYVTLEPCAHHGKTPPCAEALIAAGLTRVVTALTDPDPRVSGKGHAMLRAAGIAVTEHILDDMARRLNAGFLKRVTQGLPFVTLKLAATIDGRIATSDGESRWITGPQARRFVHSLRLNHDAVMVGSGTARADDPDLTARDIGATHQPIRILLDRNLSHRPDSRLGATARLHPVWILHALDAPEPAQHAWAATGARLLPCTTTGPHLDLSAALRILATQGITRVLSEGGGTIAAALVKASLVDDLIHLTAGRLMGADGTAALGPFGLTQLADAPAFDLLTHQTLGPDTLTHWRRA
ncbi:MAG: bifunctional diaminohydroxyphosphoribosylaminopyrimidine deaminase/5-amino-6-(5-phosphoribosylamino)uracil reductase RibD [Pseudotabrizicola sp.]|uniref:bifunctional diaminohydroxyphosphoribosylaminopyrimidine deaminase/5-amino-6-(5-phosphoribosylamino)uracil reductase RibD n=1 Tax=Pseudotabrizicola sp. TaxID=2939647 RepID=UPI00271DC53A|nr:bifunctional diaminohydroxyphosphoribosylaminopyrimidine deaminase/5-amino-6-(5-phosphoribosylamino)uracil reductase RibD [Pseudotabrizicola sp.]MDO8883070.1 bifunctional diaminohydroxyphosphoribosylaminopyrimidine deaminase/5-amino-6-(5-phosphoribosylamino)uracil reductase RibD [Pseudotabrizicola sp.]MDP2080661.1 bifunctional diaminohydroxyphosphoribosylaminopyrimidine deaminase/5-amino-6-(5-phosphoribosylamino)uracil reductase RibD [Pseudotabrizicola sp.]MDZ7573390.1 bifunctional diaminohyd